MFESTRLSLPVMCWRPARAPVAPRLAVLTLAVLTLAVLTLAAGEVEAQDRRQDRHVVLVSVDGMSASYLRDPRVKLPNLRKLAKQGATAEGMLTSFPSVTWPAHTSLITGASPARHGVIGNSVWSRKTNARVTYIGDPVFTKDQAIRVPTLYDAAHKAGLSTAGVIWPCSNGATTLDWIIPDSNKPQIHARYTTPGFAKELAEANIDISQLGAWGWDKRRSTARDHVYTDVTRHLLTRHKVNLIALHLITPDGVEHAYGPNTPEAYQAVSESDQRIGEIWKVLQQPEFAENSTLFIVSDHGFAPYRKIIRPNVVLQDLGLIQVGTDGKVLRRRAWCVPQGGSAFVYLLDKQQDASSIESVIAKLADIEGVLSVMKAAEFVKLGIPSPADNPEAPDLVMTTGPGYSFAGNVRGDVVAEVGGQRGSHGHDPRPDYMHATFIAVGAGIKPGVQLKLVRNIDVAPTIAHILGVEMPSAEGRVLREILAP